MYLVPSAGNILSILTTGIRTLIVSASNYLTDISWKDFPKPIDLKSKFGNFHSSIYTKDNKIYIVHQLFMRKGVYKPGEYTAFLDFRKQVAEQYNGKIILKKNKMTTYRK